MNSRIQHCVLYAGHHDDACELLSTLLGFSGIEANPISTVDEAIRMARSEQFDFYLWDSALTDDDNCELHLQMRAVPCGYPFLFFSGVEYDADKRRGN